MCPRFLFADTNNCAHKGHHPNLRTLSTHGRNRTLTIEPAPEIELKPEQTTRTYLINGSVAGKPQSLCNGNRRKVMIWLSFNSFTS